MANDWCAINISSPQGIQRIWEKIFFNLGLDEKRRDKLLGWKKASVKKLYAIDWSGGELIKQWQWSFLPDEAQTERNVEIFYHSCLTNHVKLYANETKHYSYGKRLTSTACVADKITIDRRRQMWMQTSGRSTHWHLQSANSASITLLDIQSRRLGAGMQCLASAVPPATAWMR